MRIKSDDILKINSSELNIQGSQGDNAIVRIMTSWLYHNSNLNCSSQITEKFNRPPLRIRRRIPEHFHEDGLSQHIQFSQGGTAFGAEGFGIVEDRRDSTLLGKGGEGDGKRINHAFGDMFQSNSAMSLGYKVIDPHIKRESRPCLQYSFIIKINSKNVLI